MFHYSMDEIIQVIATFMQCCQNRQLTIELFFIFPIIGNNYLAVATFLLAITIVFIAKESGFLLAIAKPQFY